MASLLTPEFVAANGPARPTRRASAELLAQWHRRKTAIYTELVESGALPGRPGIARIAERGGRRGLGARRRLDVGRAIRARRARARGRRGARGAVRRLRRRHRAGTRSRHPTSTCSRSSELGARSADDAVVIEDSGNGVQAAVAAGLRTLVTVSSYTADEDFTGASLVVSVARRSGGEPAEVIADPLGVRPARTSDSPTCERSSSLDRPPTSQEDCMTSSSDAEFVVRTIAADRRRQREVLRRPRLRRR